MSGFASVEPRSLEEIKAFFIKLRAIDTDVAKQARKEFYQVAKDTAEDARRRAPRRTGKLAMATKPRVSSNGDAMIVNSHRAARPNEFGGRHPLFGNRADWYEMDAHPFMFPAARAHEAQFMREADLVIRTVSSRMGFK